MGKGVEGVLEKCLNEIQNTKKAEKHWRECILNNNVSYKDMVQCVYYGGKDFEHIFLSNDKYKEIILDNEKK